MNLDRNWEWDMKQYNSGERIRVPAGQSFGIKITSISNQYDYIGNLIDGNLFNSNENQTISEFNYAAFESDTPDIFIYFQEFKMSHDAIKGSEIELTMQFQDLDGGDLDFVFTVEVGKPNLMGKLALIWLMFCGLMMVVFYM